MEKVIRPHLFALVFLPCVPSLETSRWLRVLSIYPFGALCRGAYVFETMPFRNST